MANSRYGNGVGEFSRCSCPIWTCTRLSFAVIIPLAVVTFLSSLVLLRTGVWYLSMDGRPEKEVSLIDHHVFRKAQACLLDSPFAPTEPPSLLTEFRYQPPDDIEEHYQRLINITAPFRDVKMHTYANYSGPWIENMFIKEFCCDKPLSYFGGLIPLFVQWTDLWLLKFHNWLAEPEGKRFLAELRKDVIYLAVSQHDQGLYTEFAQFRPEGNWNILVLSGGGHGHAPIPYFLKEQPFDDTPRRPTSKVFVFAGNFMTYGIRFRMHDILTMVNKTRPFAYDKYAGPDWLKVMKSGLLNLAPRGWGRSSFRLFEAIQLGLIPVYLYDDHDWSPYKGTEAHISNFGFSIKITELKNFAKYIVRKVDADPNFLMIEERLAKMKKLRDSHYTLKGLMRQIRYFFQGDSRSSIRCQRHPRTQLCCDGQIG